jgi:hypothetical protein
MFTDRDWFKIAQAHNSLVKPFIFYVNQRISPAEEALKFLYWGPRDSPPHVGYCFRRARLIKHHCIAATRLSIFYAWSYEIPWEAL